MGFKIALFTRPPIRQFICPVCTLVAEAPVFLCTCIHVYCTTCAKEWRVNRRLCAKTGCQRKIQKITQLPRITRETWNKLEVECAFKAAGCGVGVLKLEDWSQHEEKCNWNPENHAKCEGGCGAKLSKYTRRIGAHDCMEYVLAKLASAEKELAAMKAREINQSGIAGAMNPDPVARPLQLDLAMPPAPANEPEYAPPPPVPICLLPQSKKPRLAPTSAGPKTMRPSVLPINRAREAGASNKFNQPCIPSPNPLLKQQLNLLNGYMQEISMINRMRKGLPSRNGDPTPAPVAHSSATLPVSREPPTEKEGRDCYPLLIAKKGDSDSCPLPMLLPKVKRERGSSSSDGSD